MLFQDFVCPSADELLLVVANKEYHDSAFQKFPIQEYLYVLLSQWVKQAPLHTNASVVLPLVF